MPDVDFVDTEDVEWATGEDVAFDGTYVATTSRIIFLFDNDDRLFKLE